MNHRSLLRNALATAALAGAAAAAQAQVQNGDFTQGLAFWNPQGDVAVQGGVLKLSTANFSFETGSLTGNVAPLGIEALEAAAGVPAYALDVGWEAAVEGSLAKQSFAVQAGSTLSFSWSFSTTEAGPLAALDHAFAVINGQVITLATAGANQQATAAPSAQSTISVFEHTFGQAGMATLVFGVADTLDDLAPSTLSIHGVTLAAPVPEPQTWALMLGGLALLSRRLRRR